MARKHHQQSGYYVEPSAWPANYEAEYPSREEVYEVLDELEMFYGAAMRPPQGASDEPLPKQGASE